MNDSPGRLRQPEASARELSALVLQEIDAGVAQIKDRSLRRMLLAAIRDQMDPFGPVPLRRSFTTLVVCRSLCGQVGHALPAAAAVEFFAAALDVFDDIEDQDNDRALWKKYGQAQSLNAATALLMLSQLAVARLRLKGVDEGAIARAMEAIAAAGATACAGQHNDLAYELNPTVTEAGYFRMAGMKSGALVECASRLGALLAHVQDPVVESAGLFGRYLGIAAQITNDVNSTNGARSGNSDITKRKKTLPVVFALAHAEHRDRDWLATVYLRDTPVDSEQERRVLEILRGSGAVHYSLVQAELYTRKAVSVLRRSGIPSTAIQDLTSALGI